MFKNVPAVLSVVFSLTVCVASASAQSGRVQATPSPTPADETLRISTEEIKLNVLAFDESGKFFPDVSERDLVVTENNVLHPPTSVRRIPANVLIVMDTGGEMRSLKSLDQTRKTALAVVSALRPDDQVAILQYSDRAEIILEWTADRPSIMRAIKTTKFGRRSAFVDALGLARNFFARSGIDNKHLVLITDGTDSSAGASAKFDALRALLSTDISVHVISYTLMESTDIEPRTRGISKTPPPKAMPDEVAAQLPNGVRDAATAPKIVTINMDRTLIKKMKARQAELIASQEQLERLADDTNGEFILPDTLDEMIAKAPLVAIMIDASYVITYMPKIAVIPTRGIAERNIEVTSKRPGLIVQSKRKVVLATPK